MGFRLLKIPKTFPFQCSNQCAFDVDYPCTTQM